MMISAVTRIVAVIAMTVSGAVAAIAGQSRCESVRDVQAVARGSIEVGRTFDVGPITCLNAPDGFVCEGSARGVGLLINAAVLGIATTSEVAEVVARCRSVDQLKCRFAVTVTPTFVSVDRAGAGTFVKVFARSVDMRRFPCVKSAN